MNSDKFSLIYRLEQKLFRGYIREPIPIFIVGVIVIILVATFSLWATWDLCFAQSDIQTEVQECVITGYLIKDSHYELIDQTGKEFSLPVEAVTNPSVLAEWSGKRICVLVEYETESHGQPYEIIGVSNPDGTQLISAKEISTVKEAQATKALIWIWGICGVTIAFLGGAYYVLCNAPQYPRLAKLLVREQWRYF